MSFIRPEAARALARWREVVIGAGLALGGLWWAWGSFGFRRWFAVAVALLGLAVLWQGLRRARFRPGTGAPGLVEVDERQITYFGPEAGGAVSIDALTRVTIFTADGTYWLFDSEDAPPLSVPVAAEGADQLFDAIAALPGADYDTVLRATKATVPDRHLVWEKAHRRLH